jgi:serine/threonine protein kinase/Tfp pilus assembly protein PilF
MVEASPPDGKAFNDPREELSLNAAMRLDVICEKFEQDLRGSSAAAIERYLNDAAGPERTALLRELLALELEYRAARHEQLQLEDYLTRFPEYREVVHLTFVELDSKSAPRGSDPTACLTPIADARTPMPSINSSTIAIESSPSILANHPRYRTIRRLGVGGMGAVYLAEHRIMQRLVALKVIRPDILANDGAQSRFDREIKAAGRLHHPNIVTAYDAERIEATSILVMEYAEGIDLAHRLAECGPLPIPQACEFARQAALGLQHAHESGLVHRDIKPQNLILVGENQIKILDFGLAHFVSEAGEMTQAGTMLGSINYMAPEQASNPRSAGIQADIYSLGCTLYELISGRPPFPTGSLFERIKAHAAELPPRIEGLSPELWSILKRMLEKNPAQRYQEPREVAGALEPFCQSTEGTANAKRSAPKPVGRLKTRRRRALLTGLFLVVLITAGWLFWKPRVPAVPPDVQRLYDEAVLQLSQRREGSTKAAIKKLVEALKKAPEFLNARIALANAYNLQGDYGWEMPDDVFPNADANARKAIDADPNSAEAHLARAFTIHEYYDDWRTAGEEYQTAIDLDKNPVEALHWYAWFLVQEGHRDLADDEIKRAAHLGTTNVLVVANVGRIQYFAGLYNEAVTSFKHAISLDSEFGKAHLDLAMTYVELGKSEEALGELKLLHGKGLTEDNRDLIAAHAYVLARGGKALAARDELIKLEAIAASKPLAYEIATIYAALGDSDTAFHWLQKAFDQHSPWRTFVKIDPRWNGLRDDERFKPFLEREGF